MGQDTLLGLKFDTYDGNELLGTADLDDRLSPVLEVENTLEKAFLTRGTGLGREGNGALDDSSFNACEWTPSSTRDTADHFRVRVAPKPGSLFSLSSLVFTLQASPNGPSIISVRSNITGDKNLFGPSNLNGGGPLTISLNLLDEGPAFQQLAGPVEFYIYGWGSSNEVSLGRCLRIEAPDPAEFDLLITGCQVFPQPVLATSFFNDSLLVCPGQLFSSALSMDHPGQEGEDYVFYLKNLVYDLNGDGVFDGTGYGPLSGGQYSPGQDLEGPFHLAETLSGGGNQLITLRYEIGSRALNQTVCANGIDSLYVTLKPDLPFPGFRWIRNDDTVGTQNLLACVGDTLRGYVFNLESEPIFLQVVTRSAEDGFVADSLFDGSLLPNDTVNLEQWVPQAPGNIDLGLVTFFDANQNGKIDENERGCTGDTLFYQLSVLPRPILQPSLDDTVCSNEPFVLSYALSNPEFFQGQTVSALLANIFYRDYDLQRNFLGSGNSFGPVEVVSGDSLVDGQRLPLPATVPLVLKNKTNHLVSVRFAMYPVVNGLIDCRGPLDTQIVWVLPPRPDIDKDITLNGAPLPETDSLDLCAGDSLSWRWINRSDFPVFMVRQQARDSLFSGLPTTGKKDTVRLAPGDTLTASRKIGVEDFRQYVYFLPDWDNDSIFSIWEKRCEQAVDTFQASGSPPPVILNEEVPTQVLLCEGVAWKYTMPIANPAFPFKGQWQISLPDTVGFQDLPDETSPTIEVEVPAIWKGAALRYRLSNACDTVFSPPISVDLIPNPDFLSLPVDTTVCDKGIILSMPVLVGNADTLVCEIDEGDGFRFDTRVFTPGANILKKEFKLLAEKSLKIRFIAINSCKRDTSASVTINVPPALRLLSQPLPAEVCGRDSAVFEVEVANQEGGTWEFSTDGESWENFGISSPRLVLESPSLELDSGFFRYKVYNACDTLFSQAALIRVYASCFEWVQRDTCNCLGNETLPGAGDGQFLNTVVLTGPPNVDLRVGAGSEGLFGPDQANARLPLVPGTPFVEVSAGRYQLVFRTVNQTPFVLEVARDTLTGLIPGLTISSSCAYERFSFESTLRDTSFCLDNFEGLTIPQIPGVDSAFCWIRRAQEDTFRRVSVFNKAQIFDEIVVPDTVSLFIQAWQGCNYAISDTVRIQIIEPQAQVMVADSQACFRDEPLLISARDPQGFSLPQGFRRLFLLSVGNNKQFSAVAPSPLFEIDQPGTYRIHALIYDPRALGNTLGDFLGNQVGQASIGQVQQLLTANFDCADLDTTGLRLVVDYCADYCDEGLRKEWAASNWIPNTGTYENDTHAFRFFQSPINGNTNPNSRFNKFIWNPEYPPSMVMQRDTVTIRGELVNQHDQAYRLDVFLVLVNPKDWETWSALGRRYLLESNRAEDVAARFHPNWTFWEVSPVSRMVGVGKLSGTLFLSHFPENLNSGIQLGLGANRLDRDYGLGGDFKYNGFVSAKDEGTFAVNAEGSVNMDVQPVDTTCGITGDYPPFVTEFKAEKDGTDQVVVSWKTLVAGNIGEIILQRSIDDQIYQDLRTYPNGNNLTIRERGYVYVDNQVTQFAVFFYRLKVTDNQGRVWYIPAEEVSFISNSSSSSFYQVYPNPAVGKKVNVRPTEEQLGTFDIHVMDNTGKRIRSWTYPYSSNGFQLDFGTLANGVYYLQIISPDDRTELFSILLN